MDNLAHWLGAQLDEDERIARAAAAMTFGTRWLWDNDHGLVDESDTGVVERVQVSIGQHIAEWDPARVLREVAATRRMIEAFERCNYSVETAPNEDMQNVARAKVDTWRFVLHLRALSYSGRPGYREEWRP